ncbi:hypothetical protein B0T16DRAFT_162851 [Cercophora newfieldiana]|uniref:Uncharacterized protein n=1 Tax=Cercophora newfieldiana TaxID=92897 RepID=A0AA39Y5N0_9PEZI|nr:hypothetical protein B0T16DRAFT_162851 [Cercophora newfieldiana]
MGSSPAVPPPHHKLFGPSLSPPTTSTRWCPGLGDGSWGPTCTIVRSSFHPSPTEKGLAFEVVWPTPSVRRHPNPSAISLRLSLGSQPFSSSWVGAAGCGDDGKNNTKAQSRSLWLPRALRPKTHHRIGSGTHLTPLPCLLLSNPYLRRVAAPPTARDLVGLVHPLLYFPSRPSARPSYPGPKSQASLHCAPSFLFLLLLLHPPLIPQRSPWSTRSKRTLPSWAVDSNGRKNQGAAPRESPLPPLRSTRTRVCWLAVYFCPAAARSTLLDLPWLCPARSPLPPSSGALLAGRWIPT